ncbi:2OG-Fe(II) oxygenase [Saccharospirillum salsuginis]|uniref:2OG-Fe(II) oxygenase n=1 Tax=Saccharospirillum salsuginis TaxID=418750 RepID=A0A918KSC4_9GAMM|nr:2OG-Fe(II) oxygenase [Saccharospirillum salsuginis]GGX75185.1 hypothetical protein GCM10007392_48000 [Saccharospirillum salsuginis]
MGTQDWPEWSDSFIKAGFPKTSLLANTEPAVWQALGRLNLKDFNAGKQVVVRQALDAIGLGWVATNTTPFRIAVGGLFDAARDCHRLEGSVSGSNGSSNEPTSRSAPSIQIDRHSLPEADDGLSGPLDDNAITSTHQSALWSQLEHYGACVIRNAVPDATLSPLPDSQQAKITKLAHTVGNGVAGCPPSDYMDLSKPPDWHNALVRTLERLLVSRQEPNLHPLGHMPLTRKSILLRAGEGAENWAHQDNNSENPPVQAVLMLSEPQKDFTGGEFYVARQTRATDGTIDIQRFEVTFAAPGDLVIFKAGKDSGWWHGMLPVKAGTLPKQKQDYLREAVGLLQPLG